MEEYIKINGEKIGVGEEKQINVPIARIPTHTQIHIPIYVSRSKKEGPTLLVMAGMHGDEINGVETLRRILVRGLNRPKRGSVISIPILNIFGFINFSREVTDGKDVNRSFPGSTSGSLASQVAHYMTHEILPQINYGLDFHTGGARRNNYPQIRAALSDLNNQELANAFNPPFIINSPYRDKSFRKQAAKEGIPVLVFEGGESLRLRKSAIDEGLYGFLRLMNHLQMIDEAPLASEPPIQIDKTTWVRAKISGLQHTFCRNGSRVSKNEIIGLITDPFGEFEAKIESPVEGYIIGINNNPVINRGDPLIHIGLK